jgi:4a-hydroxytetrahydrobiopterin dehydratase
VLPEGVTVSDVLSADEVATALEALPGWSGGVARLERDVPVSREDQHALIDAIAAVAQDLNHHPDVRTSDTGVHVALTTYDAGGVTERDVELATHLDRLFSGGTAWDKY